MCGIFGVVGDYDDALVRRSLALLSHRGPDDEGFFPFPGGCLAHRRLSIVDPSTGNRQPMLSVDGRAAVVFNGEIYNHQALRDALVAYPFRGRGDSETVLAAYLAWGDDFVHRLRGMFAIAVWDERSRSLRLYRDRLGEKPIYYHVDSRRLIFASEIKALVPHLASLAPDTAAVAAYLAQSAPVPPATMFAGIRKLPAGHGATFADATLRTWRYYDLLASRPPLLTEREAIDALRPRVVQAVDRCLSADVDVGVLLSGGLDSSLVAALAQRRRAELGSTPLQAVSVGYPRALSEHDERPFARRVAREIGAQLHEVALDEPEFIDALREVVRHLDQPINDAACVPTFVLARALRQRGLKVALCGEGGDESFLGYERYVHLLRLLRSDSAPLPVPPSTGRRGGTWRRRIARGTVPYLGYGEVFTEDELDALLDSGLPRIASLEPVEQRIASFLSSRHARDHAAWMSYVDLGQSVGEVLLARVDAMGMAHGVELRSPFVDHELVQCALDVEEGTRLGDGSTKYLLRRIAEAYLSREIVSRPKQGFSVPWVEWLLESGELSVIRAVASETGWFRASAIDRLLLGLRDGLFREHVWGLYVLALWVRRFFGAGS